MIPWSHNLKWVLNFDDILQSMEQKTRWYSTVSTYFLEYTAADSARNIVEVMNFFYK